MRLDQRRDIETSQTGVGALTPTPRSARAAVARARGRLSALRVLQSPLLSLPVAIIVLMIVTTAVEPRFFDVTNFQIVGRQMSLLAIVAVGQAFAIIAGGFDLSVGSVLGAAGVVGALIMRDQGLVAGIVAGMCTAMLLGSVNGAVIARLNVSPFVVTLGMLSAARGLALTVSDGQPIYDLPQELTVVGTGWVGPIAIPVIIAVGAIAIGGFILHRTVLGQHIFAVGGNEEAARLAGVNVGRVKFATYVIVGAFVGLASIVFTARVAAGQPNAGTGFELDSIAAVIIGGVRLGGGVGNIGNVVLGVVFIGLLSNALQLMNVSSYTQLIVIGAVIVAAVALDRLRYRGV